MEKTDALRFGAEFGPKGVENPSGVSLSTFKTLVWVSNVGGLILFAIGLELMVVQQSFGIGLALLIAGVVIALFPSNYEIRGMEEETNSLENYEEE